MGKWSTTLPDIEAGGRHKVGRSTLPPPAHYFSAPAPQPWFPWLVPLVFVANMAVFALSMYLNNGPANAAVSDDQCLFYRYLRRFSFQPFRENPLLGPSTATLKELGALDRNMVVEGGEGWRLLSCMWLHAGVIHLLANMLSLLFIGIRLEQEFGFLRIGALYVLSGFGGSLLSSLSLNPTERPTISVGASGALFGLLGAMLSELLTNWTIYANKCAALVTLLLIIVLNLAFGFLPRVDNSAHVGGFIAGFLLGFILLVRPQFGYVSRKYMPQGCDVKRKPKHKCYQYVLWIVALLALLFGYAYCLVKLFVGDHAFQKNISF